MSGRVVSGKIALGLAVLAVLVWAPSAGAYVYWGDLEEGTVGRAANDGTAVDPDFVAAGDSIAAVAVDPGHVYWADSSRQTIGRAKLDGTGVDRNFVTGVGSVNALAVNDKYVFWSNFSPGVVGRANLDGTSPSYELIKEIPLPCGVALDAGHVYWLSQDDPNSLIGRAEFGGLGKEPAFAKIAEGFQCGLAVDPLHLYWTDFGIGFGSKIGRADVSNGGNVDNSFIAGASGPCGIAAFSSKLFWANATGPGIGTANADRTGLDQALIQTAPTSLPCGVAVDSLAPAPAGPSGPSSSGGKRADSTPPRTRIAYLDQRRLSRGKATVYYVSDEAATYSCKLDGRKASRCGRWNGGPLCKPLPPKCNPHRTYVGLAPGRHKFRVWATDLAGNKDRSAAKLSFRIPG